MVFLFEILELESRQDIRHAPQDLPFHVCGPWDLQQYRAIAGSSDRRFLISPMPSYTTLKVASSGASVPSIYHVQSRRNQKVAFRVGVIPKSYEGVVFMNIYASTAPNVWRWPDPPIFPASFSLSFQLCPRMSANQDLCYWKCLSVHFQPATSY